MLLAAGFFVFIRKPYSQLATEMGRAGRFP